MSSLLGSRKIPRLVRGDPEAALAFQPHLVLHQKFSHASFPDSSVSGPHTRVNCNYQSLSPQITWTSGLRNQAPEWFPFKTNTTLPWPAWLSWMTCCKVKGSRFDSWSGHVPMVCVPSPLGVHTKGNQLMFLFLSFSLPSPFSKTNK